MVGGAIGTKKVWNYTYRAALFQTSIEKVVTEARNILLLEEKKSVWNGSIHRFVPMQRLYIAIYPEIVNDIKYLDLILKKKVIRNVSILHFLSIGDDCVDFIPGR